MIPSSLIKRVDEKLEILKAHRPLSPTLVQKLKENFSLELTYNSNAIEGNRLTLKETMLVIQEGMTVKGKSLKDHLEAKNHYEAIQFLYELIEVKRRHSMSEHLVRSIQQLVVREIESGGGEYRKGSVIITGSQHRPPNAAEVPRKMSELVRWIKTAEKTLHPIQLAALAHHKLVHIHPFDDGNGRTARLFMNLLLMQNGYPLVVILKGDRKKYYRSLEKADKGNTDDFEKLIAQSVERSMNLYLQAIESRTSRRSRLQLLSELAKSTTFSAKYLNLLARSGKLEAHKDGRNWLSSEEAIESYLDQRERKQKKRSGSVVRESRVPRKVKRPSGKSIDYSDIPEASNEELSRAHRVGRPSTGNAKQLIAVRISPDVIRKLKKLAAKTKKPYQTLVSELLEKATNGVV